MKEHSVSTPEPEDNYVSDFSVSFVENIDSHDASALKDALMFLKGTLRAREEDLARLRKEKDAAMESKLDLMMENKVSKRETEEMSKKLIQAEKEKEAVGNALKKELAEMLTVLSQIQKEKAELIMDVKHAKSEVVEMGKKLVQAEKEKEAAGKETIELGKETIALKVTEKALKLQLAEMSTVFSQIQNEKTELMMDVKHAKSEVVEMDKKLVQAETEKKAAATAYEIELAEMSRKLTEAKKEKESAMESKIDLLVEALKQLKKEVQVKEVLEKTEKTPAQKQKKESTEEVEVCKEDTTEVTRKLTQAQLLIEEAMKLKGELLTIELKNSKMEKSGKKESFLSRGQELGVKLEAEIQVSKTESQSWNRTSQTLENVKDELNECMRPFFVWKNSGTKIAVNNNSNDLLDVLSFSPQKSGTFEWKIRVQQGYNDMRLGVIISPSKDVPSNHWIGSCKKSWGYSYGAIHDNTLIGTNFPKFSNGSVIRFRLDLTENGTLSVSVDGSSFVEMFTNMISSLDKDEGFLPAATLTSGSKIEILANDL